eukprot:TRINITY_DN27406_c0_g1_i9.p1 TRINITY_DN27406_c0_g1~~TRINITY_DN27406_c0_g1_i9.p1  ORF type:complete len:694 (+),score=53.36 TRINITY_DN27406_c0_g1_i9:130-2211(+)
MAGEARRAQSSVAAELGEAQDATGDNDTGDTVVRYCSGIREDDIRPQEGRDDHSRERTSVRVRQNQVLVLLRADCPLARWRLRKAGSDELFARLDADQNGTLSKAELTGLAERHPDLVTELGGPLRALLNPGLVQQAWKLMDEDRNGFIDKCEWNRFICICSYNKLRFLKALHHLDGACFWGYGQLGSLQTPFAFWGDPPPDMEPLENGMPVIGRGVPEWELRRRRLFWGLVEVPRGWLHDLWYYITQNHTLVSMFFVDEDHPLDRWERVVNEFVITGYTLMMMASREWLSALMVADNLPGACRTGGSGFWDCVEHNCLCRPGNLCNCRDMSCASLELQNISEKCADYGAVDPAGKLCFQSMSSRHAWLVWTPLYLFIFVTLPSQFLSWLLVMLLSSPCTVWDITTESYTHTCTKDFCSKKMPFVYMGVFFCLAIAAWALALYMTFTQFWRRLAGYSPEEQSDWTPSHRISSQVLQLLLILLVQFNPYAAKLDSNGVACMRLRCWARCGPVGKWHRERLDFLTAKYCASSQREDPTRIQERFDEHVALLPVQAPNSGVYGSIHRRISVHSLRVVEQHLAEEPSASSADRDGPRALRLAQLVADAAAALAEARPELPLPFLAHFFGRVQTAQPPQLRPGREGDAAYLARHGVARLLAAAAQSAALASAESPRSALARYFAHRCRSRSAPAAAPG